MGVTRFCVYLIEKELGRGGMGCVWLVKSNSTGHRFAVKQALLKEDKHRKAFMEELLTWIDLPDHPNLVPCCFFRTVEDEVVIFAEYVAGGSLKDWIDSRKLYAGGEEKALERILDIAIQFAWGLHCVHELGLVHQDVKPANVMISEEAQAAMQGLKAKVSDYGLARAAGDARFVPESGQSILVSSGGYTPAYCSPEQAAGRKLDRRTDIWSWGVSVMEMFRGEVTWLSGCMAAETLEAFLEHNGEEAGIPAMPVEVAELLMGCFCEDLVQRWESFETVLQKLRTVYKTWVGKEYVRVLDQIESGAFLQPWVVERKTREGASWNSPCEWFERALREEGRDPSDAEELILRQGRTRRGQLAADMVGYDIARSMFERLIKGGRKDLANGLANLCGNAAFVHATVDDIVGAVALYDCAIGILKRLINVEGRNELTRGLAVLYMNKASVVMSTGDISAAVEMYDFAIEIFDRLINVKGQREFDKREFDNYLADLYMGKANAFEHLGDKRTAMTLYDSAIEIRERLVNAEGRSELVVSLATLYMNKAAAVEKLGNHEEAMVLFNRAIGILEPLVNEANRIELGEKLATAYQNKAVVFMKLGVFRTAVEQNDLAIEIRERLVNIEGRSELADSLATLYMNKAYAVMSLGDSRNAVPLYDRAVGIFERLVNVQGRYELSDNLATLYMNKALAVILLGDNQVAAAILDRAIEIRERLVNVEGRDELSDSLATLYMNKAVAVMNTGDFVAGVALCDRSIWIRERLVNVEGRYELASELAKLYLNKAIAVWNIGDDLSSVVLYDRAIEMLERLVNVEERRELANDLATCYMNKAVVVMNMGKTQVAVKLYDQGIDIFERLVNDEGRCELASKLADLYLNKALVVSALGDNSAAEVLCDWGIEYYEKQVNVEGQCELVDKLAKSYLIKATVLGNTKDKRAALILYDQVIKMYQWLIVNKGRSDLISHLSFVEARRGEL